MSALKGGTPMQVQAAYDAMTESLRHNMDANLHLDYSYEMLHGTIYME